MLTDNRVTDNKVLLTAIILTVYFLGQFGSKFFYPYYAHLLADVSRTTRGVIWHVIYYGALPLSCTALLFGWRRVPEALGLDRGFGKGLWMAAVITAPMFIGYAWLSGLAVDISEHNFIFGSLSAPFFEEFFFRAFLFGLLVRVAGWKVLPATLLDAFVFGIIHVSQGDDFVTALQIFAVTGAGAAGFSIIYKEWDWNLWLVIFIHAGMNLSWMMFDVASNPVGGTWANVFRVMTVVIAIAWTMRHTRNKKRRAEEIDQEGGGAQVPTRLRKQAGDTFVAVPV